MDQENEISNVSKKSIAGERGNGGIGYVALPIDVDRDTFVQQCLDLNTISMVTENFEFINNVPVDAEKMQYLRFPTDPTLIGSTVVWINIPKHNFPVIIAVLNPKDQATKITDLNSYNLTRRNPVNQSVGASFKILGEKGKMMITTEGESGGESIFSVKVYNNDMKGLHQTYIQGTKETEVEDTIVYKVVNAFEITIQDQTSEDTPTIIKYVRNSGFTYSDQYGNEISIVDGKIKQVSKAFLLTDNESNEEPVTLGDKAKDALDTIADNITQLVSILQTWTSTDSATAGTLGLAGLVAAVPLLTELQLTLQEMSSKNELILSKVIKVV